ncbi:zinc finger CCCH domain-containing protein 19-like isoform X3 [Magnolia sinica]|uniref:zinc finger CCCH domain-containing protein 19-like isoform X3 n=1 Tax=Magnolia sinica TaxID=86752 RepID=UPI00265AF54D|nr:zinc finger CCCH domain-containing protein 19-like isoform X3 [Magnolia sinica]
MKRARKRRRRRKEEVAEDYCFTCKDGGLLVVCEYQNCLKAYHHECVDMDPMKPETNDRWICSRHSCFICNKSSNFRCFCCPNSVCKACIRSAEFVHFKEDKSFCSDCLKLVMLIEEDIDVDSDGERVDFKDRETYECLFKEYWEIIKQGENISLEDLRTADALLKNGENNADGYNSDKLSEREYISDVDDIDYKSNDGTPLVHATNGKDVWMESVRKLCKPRKSTFVGWGSKKLIDFLTSIGKNIDKPIPQFEVSEIIRDYIQENKLIHPERKKKVICDARLHTLFGRKSVNRLKISHLLDAHFVENQELEDKYRYKSEDENVSVVCKRQQRSSANTKPYKVVPNDFKEKVPKVPIICHASITTKNIKLVYLRRSLIEEFLKNPETFESKVMDSFLRVKCDPKDGFSARSSFQLVQVTGVKRISEAYKSGGTSTDAVLQVSNIVKDIRICMVSDGDFSEEECEDLYQRMKDGLLKRPTLAELEKKAGSLHEDITNHWIDREIVLLQNLIDRANEKGWRRELFEYIERRQLLQTPSERLRLLNELPKVVADAEVDLEAAPDSPKDAESLSEGGSTAAYHWKAGKRGKINGNGASYNQMDADKENEGRSTAVYHRKARKRETNDTREPLQTPPEQLLSNDLPEVATDAEIGPEVTEDSLKDSVNEGNEAALYQMGGKGDNEGNGAIIPQKAGKPETEEKQQPSLLMGIETCSRQKDIIDLNDAGDLAEVTREVSTVLPTIDLDDINEDPSGVIRIETSETADKTNSMTENNLPADTTRR